MKAIVLAAGEGTRLRPHTLNCPKCMVKVHDKAIITYILEALGKFNIKDTIVINGYKEDVLRDFLPSYVTHASNKNFDSTNMVSTLFCAEEHMDDDILISYADIVYSSEVLKKLINCEDDIAVVVDKKWRKLWQLRMANPLADAETMKLDKDGHILELGKRAVSYDDIEGQYIGLIKISRRLLPQIIDYYHSLDKNAIYDGKDFYNMYMTSFLQLIINNIHKVKAIEIDGGWFEVDSAEDLECYEKNKLFV